MQLRDPRLLRERAHLDGGWVAADGGGVFAVRDPASGGAKQSGIGRAGSKHGIDDYLEIKYVCPAV